MASQYEAEVYHCMDPTLDLYGSTENPLHRAILLNYWRHVHLEGAAMFEEITAPDMMADNPKYHVTWGDSPFQVSTGSELKKIGHKVEKDDGLYLVSSRQAFIWPYNEQALLTGEHLYEDKSTLTIEEIDPAQAMTPQRVREIHKECLAEMEARMGPNYWVYRG